MFGLGLGADHRCALALLAPAPAASRPVELGVLVVANAAATVLRFVLFRAWVFRPRTITVSEHSGMTATLSASAPDPAAPTPVPTATAPLRPRSELPSLAALLVAPR